MLDISKYNQAGKAFVKIKGKNPVLVMKVIQSQKDWVFSVKDVLEAVRAELGAGCKIERSNISQTLLSMLEAGVIRHELTPPTKNQVERRYVMAPEMTLFKKQLINAPAIRVLGCPRAYAIVWRFTNRHPEYEISPTEMGRSIREDHPDFLCETSHMHLDFKRLLQANLLVKSPLKNKGATMYRLNRLQLSFCDNAVKEILKIKKQQNGIEQHK